MPTTEEDLDKKRHKVALLRDKVADAQFLREEREREQSREIEAKQLDAEAERLEGELDIAKEMAKVSNIKAGAADLADTVAGNIEPVDLDPASDPSASAGKE